MRNFATTTVLPKLLRVSTDPLARTDRVVALGQNIWVLNGIAAAALLMLAAGALFVWQQRGHARVLTDEDTIVLADFTNKAGDVIFDGRSVRLAIQLKQSLFLSLVSDERIRNTLTPMRQPADSDIPILNKPSLNARR